MAFKRFAILALVLLALPACRRIAIYTPEPFTAMSSADNTEKVIKAALSSGGWRVVQEEPGEIHATHSRRSCLARIAISYSDMVTIKYVGSENLDFEVDPNGTEMIHRRYNQWIETLMSDINRHRLLTAD